MTRRTFVAAFAAAPVLARIPGVQSLRPHAERRFRPVRGSGHHGRIQVEVQLAMSEDDARRLRGREARDPFDGLVGEFYISDSSAVDIPNHLPGTLTAFETVVGVAAEKSFIHTGAFRRGRYVWTVRVSGDVAWAIEVAEWIAALDLPDEARVRLAPTMLEDLLPAEGDFSIDVQREKP